MNNIHHSNMSPAPGVSPDAPKSDAFRAWEILHGAYDAMTVADRTAAANVSGLAVTFTFHPHGLEVFAIHENGDTYSAWIDNAAATVMALDAFCFVQGHAR